MVWVLIGILVVSFFVLLLYSPIVIHVQFSRISGDDEGKLVVRYLFGLIRINRSLSSVNTRMTPTGPQVSVKHGTTDDEKPHKHKIITTSDVFGFLTHLRDWIRLAKNALPIMLKFWRNIHIRHIQMHFTVGTGDTVTTGMAVGALWGILGYIIGAMSRHTQLESEPQVVVTPSYYQPMLQITFESIIKVRAGYAISAAFRLLRVWKRRTSDGTPNSGSNADSNGEHSGNGRREHDYRRSG